MKKIVLVAIVSIILPLLLVGCSEPARPPPTEYSRLVMDIVEDVDGNHTTILHISGVEVIKYSNITLTINDEMMISKTDAFSIEYRTDKQKFDLTASAELGESLFYYEANVRVVMEENIIFEITENEDVESIRRVDLPHIQRMGRMEVE